MQSKKTKLNLEYILSLPKSFYYCLRLFSFKDAIKIPVFISVFCKVRNIHKGAIRIDREWMRTGVIKFGFGGTTGIPPITKRSFLDVQESGVIEVHGKSSFGEGSSVRVGGTLSLGNECRFNTKTFISCNNRVEIKDEFLGGWSINIQDSNNHNVWYDGVKSQDDHTIHIGKHVWFCAYAEMLNGTVPDDCIVGYRALVNKRFSEENAVLAGSPAKVVKKNVTWEK